MGKNLFMNKIGKQIGNPTIEADECIQNVECAGNFEHVECHKEIEHGQMLEVAWYDCKQKFKDKIAMLDHKRDSDHPSKRKCNQQPDCERGVKCWYKHTNHMLSQVTQNSQP